MNRRGTVGTGWVRALFLFIVFPFFAGCSWSGTQSKPAWLDGTSADFPSSHYLVGVGQADNRAMATERAYAAVARVFKAEISAQAKDWESYLVIEQRGQASTERRLTLDNVTRVSTDKVLENVQILDSWQDRQKSQHYVLAGMIRSQAESAMLERIRDLDDKIETAVVEARKTPDKLAHVRNLKRAARKLVTREAYNADLRVIRTSGHGQPPPYKVAELTTELEQFLTSNLVVAVEMTGDQTEPLQRSLMEGLIREGLPVTSRRLGTEVTTIGEAGPIPDLLAKGTVRLWPIDVQDPQFKYVRWCSDFVIQEPGTQRVVGAVSKGGKEGHLTTREATAKAIRVMQQEFSGDLAKAIAAFVYGDADLPVTASPPAGCPREDGPPFPH